MKKLFLLTITAGVLLAACKDNGQAGSKDNGQAESKNNGQAGSKIILANTLTYKTLNGIDQKIAQSWIKNYQQATEDSATVTPGSYFLNKDMMEKILNILNDEHDDSTPNSTDGIRVYFGKKHVEDKETELLLVSTTYSLEKNPNDTLHHDYYGHSAKDVLFNPVLTKLNIDFEERGKSPGTTLYKPGPNPRTTLGCVDAIGSSLSVSYAAKMANRFNGINMNTHGVWIAASVLYKIAQGKNFEGLRIYLGTYHNNDHNNIGRNTIVLTAVDKTRNDDFNCEEKRSLKIVAKKFLGDDPQNNGSLCPHNCN